MSLKLVSNKPSIKGRNMSKAEEIGGCPVCKARIFSDQQWGRAPKPLLGKAHAWCGGV